MDKTLTLGGGIRSSIPKGCSMQGFCFVMLFFPAVIDFLVLFW